MLGNIASKLRLLGYDAKYSSNIKDNKIIQLAKNESRVIITKDEELSKSAIKQAIAIILIKNEDEMDQFVEINEQVKLDKCTISGSSARCPKCNNSLELIDKDLIKDRIPQGVLQKTNEFWQCQECKKIYWEGTHIENLQKFVVKLNERLQQVV